MNHFALITSHVYAIQHKKNGYVHAVFKEEAQAREWVKAYDGRTSTPGVYHYIPVPLWEHWDQGK